MNDIRIIKIKLEQFTRKYYTSELIKGTILFLSFGILYLFFTLFIEFFLWLKPFARTFLFCSFLLVEFFLLVKFIIIPIFRLCGLKKGISNLESSRIIGTHFPDVQDKLVNVLQLAEKDNNSDLLLASISQKTNELAPISFVKAINFKDNIIHLKYAFIPLLIYLTTLISGVNVDLSNSFNRVLHYKTSYLAPAPFYFKVTNLDLSVIQGKSFTLNIKTVGSIIPTEAKIIYNNQEYFLSNIDKGNFQYTFTDVIHSINFHIEANGIKSDYYNINVVKTPTINNISIDLKYPNYLKRKNESINNSGDIIVPEGTKVVWNVSTHQTDSLAFKNNNKTHFFTLIADDSFSYTKRILNSINYQIASSNKELNNFEKLEFSVDVIKDEFPVINVQSNIDSVSRGTVFFGGKISDDYGISKLRLIYYNKDSIDEKEYYDLKIAINNIQTFIYKFPEGLNLKEGVNYELYFEVSDNDAVNGSKISKSKVFNYRKNTEKEIEESLLQDQKNTITDFQKSIEQQSLQKDKLDKVKIDFQNKKIVSWSDKKKLNSFVKDQENYNKIMQQQISRLQYNLDEKKEVNENVQNKKEELKKRISELKTLDKQQKLLDEIQKMADKLNKEDLVKKTKELAQQNKQQERSLKRILELTKRFYVEQKTMQIANKIDALSKKQKVLANKKEDSLESQKEINKEFDDIKMELEELNKDNKKLNEPMGLLDVEDEIEVIDSELQKSEENLSKEDKSDAKKSQKKSSNKMKEMSVKLQKAMIEMEGDSMEENMEDLRKILDNLVVFSFKQEALMIKFDVSSTAHLDFGKDLKKQNVLKTYFEHIDDSLYVLSMRLPRISIKIKEDLSTVHYNLEQSLYNFSENRFSNGVSNQRYVMTSVNNLSDYLSNMLSSMKNSMSMKLGKGKKGKGNGFSLPDLIKKQGELSEKMKKGMKPGDKKGNGKEGEKGEKGKPGEKGGKGKGGKLGEGGEKGLSGEGGTNDDLGGEIYEIYKQQSLLRQELQEQIRQFKSGGTDVNSEVRKALKNMEDLENEILEKGFNSGTFQKMQNLNYELLKLDKAALEQGKDKERKSAANQKQFNKKNIKTIQYKKQFYNQTEILNRQSLPLQENYKNKVREYFSDKKKE